MVNLGGFCKCKFRVDAGTCHVMSQLLFVVESVHVSLGVLNSLLLYYSLPAAFHVARASTGLLLYPVLFALNYNPIHPLLCAFRRISDLGSSNLNLIHVPTHKT